MTLQENIDSLVAEAKEDLGASEALAQAGFYAHSLFFKHLVLEKLCKAVWIRNLRSAEYPFTHNLLKLLKDSSVKLSDQQIQFYSDMNLFQAKGRYPDTLHAIEKTITAEIYNGYATILQKEVEWLTQQLQ